MPTAVIAGVCSVLHVVWAALFVVYLQWGNAGAGYANLLTWTLEYVLSSIYLAWKAESMGFSKHELLLVQGPGFKEWGAYLKIALPATIQLCSEWWFWEICALVIGYL